MYFEIYISKFLKLLKAHQLVLIGTQRGTPVYIIVVQGWY